MYYSNKIINKKQLLQNFNILKSKSNKNICAVLKANAYGHDAKQICKILKSHCKFYAVHNLHEAIELRKIDKEAIVLVLGYCIDYELACKYDISVTIDNIEQLKTIIEMNKYIKIHIKINTGMNRFGVNSVKEFVDLINLISLHNNIKIEGVYTHCFNSVNKKITLRQIKAFKKFVNILKTKEKSFIAHIGGSGMVLYDNINFIDYIRVGIGLFGYLSNLTKPIMRIESKIIKTFFVNKNQYVGYDCFFKAKRKTKVAIVPLGYADGVIRQFQDNMHVYLKNCPVKIIGKICMDVLMIDITDINASIYDKVVVFNDANYWAVRSGLSVYEILTGLNKSRTNICLE